MAKTEFDTWLQTLQENNIPHRMMFVFLRVVAADPATSAALIPNAAPDSAGWVNILFASHKQLTSKMTLRSVVKDADKHNDQWSVFAATPSYNIDNSMPTEKQGAVWIEDMKDCILRGEYEGIPFFGRKGNRLSVQGAAIVSKPRGTAH